MGFAVGASRAATKRIVSKVALLACVSMILGNFATAFSPTSHRLVGKQTSNHISSFDQQYQSTMNSVSHQPWSSPSSAIGLGCAIAGSRKTTPLNLVAASATPGGGLFRILPYLHADSRFVLTAIFWLSTFGITLERRTVIGKALSAPLATMALALIFANVGVLPFSSPVCKCLNPRCSQQNCRKKL